MNRKFHNVMQETYLIKVLLLEKSENDHVYFQDMFESISNVELKAIKVENTEMLESYISLPNYDLIFIGPSLLAKAKAVDKVAQKAFSEKEAEETGAMASVYMGRRTPEEEKELLREVLFWIISDARGRSQLSGELKLSQRLLKSSEARFEKIINKNADGIVIVNTSGIVLFINPAAEDLFGRSSAELVGHEFGFPIIRKDFAEIEIFRKDRKLATAEMRIVSMEIQGEDVFLISLRDITKRKQAERIVQESEQKLRLLTDQLPVAIWTTDINLMVTSISGSNPALCLRHFSHEVIGKTLFEIFQTEDRYFEPIALHYKALNGETSEYEITTDVSHKINVAPLKDEEMVVIGTLGIATDITEQKNREKDLQAKNRELDDFAYTVSHDLKAPLFTIQCNMDNLKEDPKRADEIFKLVNVQVDKMYALIDSILNLSRAGQIINKKEDIKLEEIIQEAYLLNTLDSKNARLVTVGDFPAVKGDPGQISQLFCNIISNAVKSRDPKKADIVLEVGYKQKNSCHVISVKDNGVGIAPQNIEKIYAPAFSTRKGDGTGFGLAICKKIIEAHNGRIWAKSPGEGKGAIFYVELPV